MKLEMILASCLAAGVALAADPIRVSSFGYSPDDATEFFQKALDSDARQLVVDAQPGGWNVGPLKLTRGDLELVLEPGVVVRAKEGAFIDGHDTLLSIEDGAANVVIRGGKGSGFAMRKADYADRSRYAFSTHRHALALRGCRNVTLRDLTISDAGGDDIYVYRPVDTLIENVTCTGAFRDAMSVIAAERLTVRNCRFVGTSGTAPNCGVDIESNNPRDFLKDILFERCLFKANASSGFCVHLPGLDATSQPVSVTVRNCAMVENAVDGIVTFASCPGKPVSGRVTFEKCRSKGNARSALHLTNHEARGIQVGFAGCTFDGRGGRSPSVALGNSQISEDFAGVAFADCRVLADSADKVYSYCGMTGTGVTDVRGAWTVVGPKGEKKFDLVQLQAQYPADPEARKFVVAKLDLKAVRPVQTEPLAEAVKYPFFRNKFTFVQYVPGAGTYPVKFFLKTLEAARKPQMTVQVRDKPGTDLGSFTTDEAEFTYEIKAESSFPNVYLFEVSFGLGALASVESAYPGQGILFNDSVNLFGFDGAPFYFCVPADATTVAVETRPEEEMAMWLRDQDGFIVDALSYSRSGKVLKCARKQRKVPEIWCADIRKVREDAFFRIGAPAVPIATTDPKAVLVTGEGGVRLPGLYRTPDKPWLRGVTDKRDFISYKVGEPIRMTVTLEDFFGDVVPLKGSWKRTGDDGKTETGEWNVAEPLTVETSLSRPGFIRLEAEVVDAEGKKLCFFDGGAGVDIADIRQTRPEPADFDAFWTRRKAELAKIPIRADIIEEPSSDPRVRVYSYAVDCAGKHPTTGWVQIPTAPGKYPLTVHFQGYGGSWSPEGTRAPKGLPVDGIHVTVSAHGCLMNQPPEYYAAFKKTTESNGYGHAFDPAENEKPETAYFGGMTWRVMRAVEYAKTLPEWNGKDLTMEGGSQGGLQSIWAGALVPGVTKLDIYVPWGCNLAGPTDGRNHGDWFVEWRPGLDYYDTCNMARRIPKTCKVHITRVGLGDYISTPSGIAAFYNNLTCPKRSAWRQGNQHSSEPRAHLLDYSFRTEGM